VSIARSNIRRAYELAQGKQPEGGIRQEIRLPCLPDLHICAMDAAEPPSSAAGEPGVILTNPPYGKRLGDPAEAERTYQEMGILGRHFPGWRLGLITDHPGFESHFGKKAGSCREITNGAVQSYFYQYERP
jgi:putative N6-adenine-specific DNA methylase